MTTLLLSLSLLASPTRQHAQPLNAHRHMRPPLAIQDVGYMRCRDAIVCRDACLGASQCSLREDLRDVRLSQPRMIARQLRVPVKYVRVPAVHAPLRRGISHIVPVRSEEQVPWVDAGGVIAAMADGETIWNRAIMQLPRNAVRPQVGWTGISTVFQHPVSVRRALGVAAAGAGPRPALIRSPDVNFGPEPIRQTRRIHASPLLTSGGMRPRAVTSARGASVCNHYPSSGPWRPCWGATIQHLDYKTESRVVRTEHQHWYPMVRTTAHPIGHTVRTVRLSPHVQVRVVFPTFQPVYVLPGCPWAIARWAPAIVPAAQSVGLPTRALTGVIAIESGGNPSAYNPSSGASGLLQFLPSTAAAFGINPYNPNQAIWAGARYLATSGPVAYSGGGYGWGTIYARSCD